MDYYTNNTSWKINNSSYSLVHKLMMMKLVQEAQKPSCTECGKQFSTNAKLATHINGVHRGQKFQCPHCGSTFKLKENLQKHMKSVHDGQKFSCPQCEYNV